MFEGLNVDFAQCVMNVADPAVNALKITVGCVVDVAQKFRETTSGYNLDNPSDIDLLQHLPFSTLPKTDLDAQVTAVLSSGFEQVGLDWDVITIDRFISDIEFLQKSMLEDAKFLTENGVDIATFQPKEAHMASARDTMEALGIDADTFAGMQIAQKEGMNFDQFERLLAMKNMLDANDAKTSVNWSSEILAAASSE